MSQYHIPLLEKTLNEVSLTVFSIHYKSQVSVLLAYCETACDYNVGHSTGSEHESFLKFY